MQKMTRREKFKNTNTVDKNDLKLMFNNIIDIGEQISNITSQLLQLNSDYYVVVNKILQLYTEDDNIC